MHNRVAGMVLLIIAGMMNASFALPMKYVRTWAWENTWLLWSIVALLVLPVSLAFATIPGFASIYTGHGSVVLAVALCGAAWGVAQVMFGLALDRIGIALTFSIVLGLSAAMGSLIPLIRQHAGQLFAAPGLISLAGIALVLLGVSVSAVAGRMRDRARHMEAAKSEHFGTGLLLAIVSGVCASMMNVGFAYGGSLTAAAAAHGADSLWQTDAIWVPLMAGGALPNIAYCVYLLLRRNTAAKFSGSGFLRNTSFAATMGLLWFGSSVLYGIATVFLGDLGPVVGWPLFMSLIVIVASILGLWTGEWHDAGERAPRMQGLAVLVLVAAVVVLSRATF